MKPIDITDRPLIADPAAEKALLGSIITHYHQWPKIAGVVSGNDFCDRQLGQAFDAIVLLAQAGKKIHDGGLLRNELAAMGIGSAEIFRLISDGCHPEVSPYYAERVRSFANLRRLEELAVKLLADCRATEAKPLEVAAHARATLESLAVGGPSRAESFGEVAERVMQRLRTPEARLAGQAIMTGLEGIDSIAGAMRPGELIIIAARPGIGKTALAMQIAAHNAKRERRSLFITLEMTADEIVTRTIASSAEVPSMVIRNGTVNDQQIRQLGQAAVDGYALPIHIWGPPKAGMSGIEATAKIVAAQNSGLNLLIVDYIGLIEPANKRDDRHEQVAEISKSLKRLAKELKLPVIALCQLNREADKVVPLLSHLAESSGIEKDADMVWFIHLPDGRHKFERDGTQKVELLVAKHRHGSIGKAELKFDPAATMFREISREWNPSYDN